MASPISRIGIRAVLYSMCFVLLVQNLNGQTTMNNQNTTTIDLPEAKRTTLGLYVTSAEAYEMWKTAPETVKILDVRTPEEFIFVGHAEMAWNIPAFLQTYEWETSTRRFSMKPEPEFMTKVKQVLKPTDTILVTCRSGGRSAMAVNQLAAAGFTKVYNITDGVEGDPVDDPASVFHGKHVRNGWKNSGLPWTFSVDPKRMLLPANR